MKTTAGDFLNHTTAGLTICGQESDGTIMWVGGVAQWDVYNQLSKTI